MSFIETLKSRIKNANDLKDSAVRLVEHGADRFLQVANEYPGLSFIREGSGWTLHGKRGRRPVCIVKITIAPSLGYARVTSYSQGPAGERCNMVDCKDANTVDAEIHKAIVDFLV
jgi:hypothetical protein